MADRAEPFIPAEISPIWSPFAPRRSLPPCLAQGRRDYVCGSQPSLAADLADQNPAINEDRAMLLLGDLPRRAAEYQIADWAQSGLFDVAAVVLAMAIINWRAGHDPVV